MFDKIFVVGHDGLKRYNELCCGMRWNLQSIIAVLECTPSITTHNKAMPSLSYRVKVSRYIATCISFFIMDSWY